MVKGSHHKPESKELVRQSRVGKTHTYETRVKISKTSQRKLERETGRYRSPAGHIRCVYDGFSKYQPGWKVPIDSEREIVDTFIEDAEYKRLFKVWEDSNYDPMQSPVLMRKVKKNGFTVDNLEAKTKNSYSWWSEDSILLKCLQVEMEKEQTLLIKENESKEELVRKQAKKGKFKK